MSERCIAEVWGKMAFRPSRCSKSATWIHAGKPYCGIHYPPKVEAKTKDKHARWAKESAEAGDRYNRAAHAERLLARFSTAELKKAVDVELIIPPTGND